MTKLQKYVVALIAAMSIGVIAYSATEKVERAGSAFPLWLNKGLYIGPDSPDPTKDKQNKVTRTLGARCDYDFPSYGGAAVATGYNFDSFACSIPGVQLDDPCFVGIPRSLTQYDDAGTDILGTIFTAYVSDAGFVKVRIFPQVKLDGGAGLALVDPMDAGYLVRCISNQ